MKLDRRTAFRDPSESHPDRAARVALPGQVDRVFGGRRGEDLVAERAAEAVGGRQPVAHIEGECLATDLAPGQEADFRRPFGDGAPSRDAQLSFGYCQSMPAQSVGAVGVYVNVQHLPMAGSAPLRRPPRRLLGPGAAGWVHGSGFELDAASVASHPLEIKYWSTAKGSAVGPGTPSDANRSGVGLADDVTAGARRTTVAACTTGARLVSGGSSGSPGARAPAPAGFARAAVPPPLSGSTHVLPFDVLPGGQLRTVSLEGEQPTHAAVPKTTTAATFIMPHLPSSESLPQHPFQSSQLEAVACHLDETGRFPAQCTRFAWSRSHATQVIEVRCNRSHRDGAGRSGASNGLRGGARFDLGGTLRML